MFGFRRALLYCELLNACSQCWQFACQVVHPENGELLYLGHENYDFVVYSNSCFINNFFFLIGYCL